MRSNTYDVSALNQLDKVYIGLAEKKNFKTRWNNRSELISKYRHTNKFLLANYKSKD